MPTTRLPQLMMQLAKELRSIDLPFSNVVDSRKRRIDGKVVSVYRIGPDIHEAIKRAEYSNGPLFGKGATSG